MTNADGENVTRTLRCREKSLQEASTVRARTKDVSTKAPRSRPPKLSNDVSPSALWHELHQSLGNQGVQRLLRTHAMQPKLRVNQPNDPYEQEADRVAKQMLAIPAHPVLRTAPLRIHRYTGQGIGQADTAYASVDQVLASLGRRLDPTLRQDMEHRFGYDFSRVRVHSDPAAEQSARDLEANAYTAGHHIVFGAYQFAPGTLKGRRLIAHELTHVLQQSRASQARLQRQPTRPQPPSPGKPESHEEAFGAVTWSGGKLSVVWFDPKTNVPDEGRISHLIWSDVLFRHPEGEPADDTQLLNFVRSPGGKWFLHWAYHWPWQAREESSAQELPDIEMIDVTQECDESHPKYTECLKEARTDIYQSGIEESGQVAEAAAEFAFPVQTTLYGPESESGGTPEGLTKLPKAGRGIGLWKKGSRLRGISRPKVLEALRRAGSTEKLDERIVDAVLAYRAGPGKRHFGRNFGAARVRLEDGSTKIIKAVNVPRGTHSEEEILGVIHAIRAEEHKLGKVTVEQIFSERIPCTNCMNEVIKRYIGHDVDVFYFLAQAEGRSSRGSKLKKLYYR